jgi:hypothetical protein
VMRETRDRDNCRQHVPVLCNCREKYLCINSINENRWMMIDEDG